MFRTIPPITKNLIIINVVFYLLQLVFSSQGGDLNYMLGLHYFQANDFHLWQPLTYMFMHASLMHLFFNMFGLWMFGGLIERTFGQRHFIIYYLVCGLGAAFCQELSQFFQVYSMISAQGAGITDMMHLSMADKMMLNNFGLTVGASGCIYGILLAFGMSYPEERIFVFPLPVPVKARWFVCIYVFIELWQAISNAHGASDGIAHIAHLGGMVFGYLLIKYWRGASPQFNGWDGYEVDNPRDGFFAKISSWLRSMTRKKDDYTFGQQGTKRGPWFEGKWHTAQTTTTTSAEVNESKKKNSEEIDAILDKIRRSGYDSLTEAEKKKLFEQ